MSRLGYGLLRLAWLAVGIAVMPLSLQADSINIFNTFGPGHSSDPFIGAAEESGNFGQFTTAMAFTPSTTLTLFAIDVAIANDGDPQFTLALMTNNGGHPGSIIESWSLTSTFFPATCSHCFETVFSTQHPILQAGTQYWIVPLIGHPTAVRLYAWSHDTGDPANPKRHVTVLHSHPIKSAEDAVKAAIIQEFRNLEPAE